MCICNVAFLNVLIDNTDLEKPGEVRDFESDHGKIGNVFLAVVVAISNVMVTM